MQYIAEINDFRMWYARKQYYLNYQQPSGSQGRGWIPLIFVLISGIVFVLCSFVQIVIIDGEYSFVYQDPEVYTHRFIFRILSSGKNLI